MPIYSYALPDIEIEKLQEEILEAIPTASAAIVAKNNKKPIEDTIIVETASSLSPEELSSLEAAIDNHSPYSTLRIYAFIPKDSPYVVFDHCTPPFDTNFETGLTARLYRNLTKVFGEVQEIKYSEDAEGNLPVIIERMNYIRDSLGFAQERFTEISWVDVNNREHNIKKTLHKIYEPDDALREGKRRRGNIIDDAMMSVGYLLQVTQAATGQEALQLGRNFLKDNKLASDMFVEASDPGILFAIKYEDDPLHAWLDNQVPGAPAGYTIRRYTFDQINFWGTLWDDV